MPVTATTTTPASVPPDSTTRVRLDVVYATDEDLFVSWGADFGTIVPESNIFASGTDGVFDGTNRWTLTSASNNFISQGVRSGMVVEFTQPTTAFRPTQFLAVEDVGAHSLGLRRCGQAAGEGLPPAPAAGLETVKFKLLTLYPQIEEASYTLNEKYSVDPSLAGRQPSDIKDQRIFRRLVCLWVLFNQYANLDRASKGDFTGKKEFYKQQYDDQLATAQLRWGANGINHAPTGIHSTRVIR